MDVDQARHVLGVGSGDGWTQIRTAYRERIRVTHPDVQGGRALDAAQINDAYATLARARRAGRLPDPAPPPPSPRAATPRSRRVAADVTFVGSDRLVVDGPPAPTFARLLEALDLVGEISYVDRSAAILEAVVVLEDGTSHSLVLSLESRGATTEVTATLEALERVASSSPELVLQSVARFLPPRPVER